MGSEGKVKAKADAIEVLSVRLGESYPFTWVGCSGSRWAEALARYSGGVRHHAGNLAGHGWDVLLIGDSLFLGMPGLFAYGGTATGHWIEPDGKRHDASPKLLARLYKEGGRRFQLPAKAVPAPVR